MPKIPKALLDNVDNCPPVILKQQLSSVTALRTPTSAKMTLFLLNLPSIGGPEHVCRKHHPPLSSFSSFCLFSTYFCPPTPPQFEAIMLFSLSYIRTGKRSPDSNNPSWGKLKEEGRRKGDTQFYPHN